MNEPSKPPSDERGPNRARAPLRSVGVAILLGAAVALLVRAGLGPESEPEGTASHRAHAATAAPARSEAPPPPSASHREHPKTSAPTDAGTTPEPPPSSPPLDLVDLRNGVCPIMEQPIPEGEPGWIAYNGLKLHFCCAGCWFEFSGDPIAALTRLRDDHGVELPEGALDPARHPPVVELDNELSPIGGGPVEMALVAVVEGIAVQLSSRDEMGPFLAEPRRHLEAMAAAGFELPLERLAR